jgi:hypothetical protein
MMAANTFRNSGGRSGCGADFASSESLSAGNVTQATAPNGRDSKAPHATTSPTTASLAHSENSGNAATAIAIANKYLQARRWDTGGTARTFSVTLRSIKQDRRKRGLLHRESRKYPAA